MTVRCTLVDLARKYRVMLDLREAHARGEGVAPRGVLGALAREFPGALREIDRLPIEVLQTRARDVALATTDDAFVAPWMHWMCAWHSLYAATLAMKRTLGAQRIVSLEQAERLAAEATARTGIYVDARYVHHVAAPDGGRLAPWVLTEVAAHFVVPVETLARAVLPDALATRGPRSRPSRE